MSFGPRGAGRHESDSMNDEKTLFQGSSSLIVKMGTFAFGGIVLVASLVAAFMKSIWFLFGAGLALAYMAIHWFLNRCRVYEVTSERIRVTTGIFTRRTDELELYRVKDLTLIESLLERVLSVGSIQVTTNDASTPNLEIQAVKGARDLREGLRKSGEECREKKGVRVQELK